MEKVNGNNSYNEQIDILIYYTQQIHIHITFRIPPLSLYRGRSFHQR